MSVEAVLLGIAQDAGVPQQFEALLAWVVHEEEGNTVGLREVARGD